MSYECSVCGKRTVQGRHYTRRGRAKYLGGVGRHVTSKTLRAFRPNLQSIRIVGPEGAPVRAKVCTRCIKANKVVKAIKGTCVQAPAATDAPAQS